MRLAIPLVLSSLVSLPAAARVGAERLSSRPLVAPPSGRITLSFPRCTALGPERSLAKQLAPA